MPDCDHSATQIVQRSVVACPRRFDRGLSPCGHALNLCAGLARVAQVGVSGWTDAGNAEASHG